MNPLTLAVPGLLDPPAPLAELRAYLPPTPALDRFARASRRAASMRASAGAGAATAVAAGADAGGGWARVDPVHFAPGAGGLQLAAGAVLALADDEAAALAAHASRELALELRRATPTAWYARLPGLDRLPPSPRALARESLADVVPDDPALKRWLNDAQMALHEHPVNERRAAAGLPEVNGLWPWGNGPLDPAAALPYAHVYSDRPELIGLQRAVGRGADVAPDAYAALAEPAGAYVERLALDDAAISGSVEAWLEALAALERDWLAPACAALDAQRLARIELVSGGHAFALTRWSRWRVWRGGGFFDAAH